MPSNRTAPAQSNGRARHVKVTAEIHDNQPPTDIQAEAGVLGSILLLPDVLDDVALCLVADDFHDGANRTLYARMLAIRAAGKQIDVMLLRAALEKVETGENQDGTPRTELDDIGGSGRLAELSQSVPHAANATHYAKLVRDCSAKRELIHAGAEILHSGYDRQGDAEELVSKAEAAVFAIRDQRSIGPSRTTDVTAVLMSAMDAIAERQEQKTPNGQSTGYPDCDAAFTLRNGELIILAARTSMGKTALALNIAANVAMHAPVLVFSLEMDSIAIANRMLAAEARVDLHRMDSGMLTPEERMKLVTGASAISGLSLDIDDSPSLTPTEIAAIARRTKRRRKGLGLIVVDYLQMVRSENRHETREREVASLVGRLKSMAREIGCPVLCLAQLNRQADAGGARPRLSQLRESGATEQDADLVLFIHREEYFAETQQEIEATKGKAELIVAKHRNGPTGVVPLVWQAKYTLFSSAVQEWK